VPWRALHSMGRVPDNRENQVRAWVMCVKEAGMGQCIDIYVFRTRRARVTNTPKQRHVLSRMVVSGEARERHATSVVRRCGG
jgi:hypothetical protein